MRIVYAKAARLELQRIGVFLAARNPTAAERMVEGILQSCEALSDMPFRYPLSPGREAAGVRRRRHRSYLIFFRVFPDRVEILHVIHGAMDYEKILDSLE